MSNRWHMVNRNARRRGAVTVEMALTLPLLFLVVFASIEFSRMNVLRHTVDHAAYEAARRAIVPGASVSDAENEAQRLMRICGARGVDVDVNPRIIELDTPQVTVRVAVQADQNGFFVNQFFRSKELVGTATLRREQL